TEGALAITPSRNLVENVGWGPDATHTHSPGRTDHPAEAMVFPLVHPRSVALDPSVERELELALYRVGGRAAIIARRLIRSTRTRQLRRRIVNHRSVIALTRLWSRLPARKPS